MKILTLRTSEIDDIDQAVADIKARLLAGPRLLKHSFGMIACYADFISSGAAAALAEALPFPIAGITTIAAADKNGAGELELFLTIFTADDVEFVLGLTDPLSREDGAPFRKAWEETGAKRDDKPAMALGFAPLSLDITLDFYAEVWTDIAGNMPVFGALAVDHNPDYHDARVILGGEAYRDRYAFVLFYGNVSPEFFIAGAREEKVFPEKGVITDSQGNLLRAVNGLPVGDYLESIGLSRDEKGNIIGINTYPFILDFNDGTEPVVRAMFAVAPDGSAVCGGRMPLGASLTVGNLNGEDVVSLTREAMAKAGEAARLQGKSVLCFSCVGRYFSLGFNTAAEADAILALLGEIPWSMTYTGGEICPVYGKDRALANRTHNDTMVICVL